MTLPSLDVVSLNGRTITEIRSGESPQEIQDHESGEDDFVTTFLHGAADSNSMPRWRNIQCGAATIDISRSNQSSPNISESVGPSRSRQQTQGQDINDDDFVAAILPHRAAAHSTAVTLQTIDISRTNRGSPDNSGSVGPSRLSLGARGRTLHPYRPCPLHGNDKRFKKGCPCLVKRNCL